MPGKLSDEDIRQRLEAHNYNVPAITDTTRSVLVKKLRQLDQQQVAANSRHKSSNKPSIDYSSAEEDFTPPVSSTRKNVGAMYSARSRAGGSSVGYYRNGGGSSNTPGSRTSYKGSTTPVYKSRVAVGTYSNRINARNGGSLVNVSDDDDEVEDEEEEEEDEDEEESDEADDDSVDDKLDQYEEEITSISRTDLATQTSFNNSSSAHHEHQTETRFRGKPLPSPGGVGTSPTQYTLRSPHLRQNINKFGSLNEALATMPTSSSAASPSSGYQSTATSSRNLSIVHQASPVQVQTSTSQQRISNNNNNYSKQQQQQMYNNRVINNTTKSSSNSILISSLIVGCAALFFMYLGYKYINLSPPASTNLLPAATSEKFPLCTGAEAKEDINVKCIPGPQFNPTADLLQKMLVVLRPGDQLDCPEADQQSMFSVDELRAAANIQSDQEFSQLFQNLLILFRHNLAWGIHPVYAEEGQGGDTVIYLSVDIQRSIYCRLKGVVYIVIGLLYQAANYLFAIGLVLMVGAGGWYGWKLMRQRKQREEHEMYALLEQVLVILQDNHAEKEAVAGGSGGHSPPSFLAIVHIRDQLIPPQERPKKSRVWNKVANYIRNHESRVREEVQHIHGEEFRVWQWLSDMPPKSPISSGVNSPAIMKAYPGRVHTPVYSRAMAQHSSPISMTHSTPTSMSPGSSGSSPSAGMYNNMSGGNKSKDPWPFAPTTTAGTPGWQGSAFQLNRNVSAPVHPPTNCIKARHMFEYSPATLSNPDWSNAIKRDILNRCKDAKILHIAVDQESKEGIVYIKAMTMEDAGKVFSNLHGQWYKSQLVTAKYLREDRYHQRFPGSTKAVHKMTTA